MKSKEIFGLAVRLLGLVFLYHGLREFPAALARISAAFPRDLGDVVIPMDTSGVFAGTLLAGWPLFIAWFLLRRSSLVVRMAYRHTGPGEKTGQEVGTPLPRQAAP